MNLFICTTILHIKIVSRLLDKIETDDQALVLFIGDINSDKVSYYLSNLIAPKWQYIMYDDRKVIIEKPFKTVRRSGYAKSIIKQLPTTNFQNVYLACVELPLVHHVLSCLKFKQLMTFDDGLYNLLPEKRLNQVNKINMFKSFIRALSGRKYHTHKVLSESVKHYTIFQNVQNIIDNTEYIDVVSVPEQNGGTQKHISILLGSVYSEICEGQAEKENLAFLLSRLAKERAIEGYIPHPRDINTEIVGIRTIKTDLSAEDEISALIAQGYFVEIYGFYSTTQFILSGSRSVKNYTLRFSGMNEEYSSQTQELDTIQNSLGFMTINLSN